MPLIPFPNVPPLPGVPNLRRSLIGLGTTTGLLTAVRGLDRFGLLDALMGPQWGIFGDTGGSVIEPDTIIAIEYKGDEEISNHPVEKGGFASYNKVAKPFEVMVTMTCGGQQAMTREAFLVALDAMKSGLDLYTVVTPDVVHGNLNLVHYDYKRSSGGGVSMVTANCRFQEVRQTAKTEFTETKAPDGAMPQGGGAVTASPASAGATAAATQKPISGGGGDFQGNGASGSW